MGQTRSWCTWAASSIVLASARIAMRPTPQTITKITASHQASRLRIARDGAPLLSHDPARQPDHEAAWGERSIYVWFGGHNRTIGGMFQFFVLHTYLFIDFTVWYCVVM